MFGSITKMFIGLLPGLLNAPNHTKWISISNQKCMIQHSLINLHPNEYSQILHYCPFTVKLDKCVGSCNTLNDLSNKVYLPNEMEDLNLTVCKMIAEINESKTLTKRISREWKCKLDGRKCNPN